MSRIKEFQFFIWDFYKKNGRSFAWRHINDPYYVLVSEIMLQQTQTSRVEKKYEEFIALFPTIESLACATLRDVLSAWQGLGYYRRARYLHQTAHRVVSEHGGIIPNDPKILQTFPGIGVATAASICAFAFNNPTIFIETNIRTVFLHSFFLAENNINDKELMPFIEASVDYENPREWYYGLMDYGVLLKSQHTNPNRKSMHYAKQTKFEGSDRQLRAKILKLITTHDGLTLDDLRVLSIESCERTLRIIKQLENEKFIEYISIKNMYKIM